MQSTSTAVSPHRHLGPVGWIGRFVLGVPGYVGGVAILTVAAAGWPLWSRFTREDKRAFSFWKTLIYQLSWMIFMGIPLVGLVHIALGSFLSLQAYYGSTFVDGTGAVVGVGLLRNLGGLMTGMTFAGLLAARMIPELRILSRRRESGEERARGFEPDAGECDEGSCPEEGVLNSVTPSGLAAPRMAAAGIACLLLSQWGITVGTLVGWQASQSMMGLSTEMFFMMMMKMMWFRDVMGLIIKGLFFGALVAAICCYEGMVAGRLDDDETDRGALSVADAARGFAPPGSLSIFRATCLSFVAILFLNSSWFILVYHAVPFYGPTLLAPPGP